MRYYDFITQFEGIEHPFGDLGSDTKKEVESSTDPDRLLNLFEGDSFSDIYDHLVHEGASQECINTFVQSWVAYLEHEKKAISDPLPALILDKLSYLEDIAKHLDIISGASAELSQFLYDVKEKRRYDGKSYSFIRVTGTMDTYNRTEQVGGEKMLGKEDVISIRERIMDILEDGSLDVIELYPDKAVLMVLMSEVSRIADELKELRRDLLYK